MVVDLGQWVTLEAQSHLEHLLCAVMRCHQNHALTPFKLPVKQVKPLKVNDIRHVLLMDLAVLDHFQDILDMKLKAFDHGPDGPGI